MSSPSPQMFKALVVSQLAESDPAAAVEQIALERLPPGEVLIEVEYSSLNYKDALATMGNPGIVKSFPHVPGIDAAGRVVASDAADFQPGDPVFVTGYGLGAEAWGGFSQLIRVPAEWVVPLPEGVTARQVMQLGTAGFTAGQSVAALQHHGITPDRGEVIVTGATGGVGLWSVALLSHLGYQVTAVTGKPERHDLLKRLGASKIMGREEVVDKTDRPLLTARWAGGIDTAGGLTLATLIRSTSYRGCVAACGLVAGADLPLSVYPFLLRGVTLDGIDSAKCPRKPRMEVWAKLFGPWRVDLPPDAVSEIPLAQVPVRVIEMLAGKTSGRTLVVTAEGS